MDKKLVTAVIVSVVVGTILGNLIIPPMKSYKPDDPGYKFLSQPEGSWITELGESERTLFLYNLSELRIAVAALGQRVTALEDPNNTILKEQ